MLRYLFFTLFLLFLCSTSFVVAHNADGGDAGAAKVQSVEIFKTDKCLKTLKDSDSNVEKIENFDNVFFVTVGETLVAVAETNYTITGGSAGNKYNFVGAYSEKTAVNWDDEIFKQGGGDDICSKLKAQLVKTNTDDAKGFFTAKNVVYDKKKNIYLLAMNNTSNDDGWEYYIFVGNVSEGTPPPLAWTMSAKKELKFSDMKTFQQKLEVTKKLIGSSSTDNGAFVTKEGNVVFVLRATDDQNKYAIVFVGFKEGGTTTSELDVLHVEETAKNCYPYLFLWDEKIVMITADCSPNNNKNVKEFSDLMQWKESSGTFYYFSEFFKDKTSFTTADINSRTVLLFAQKKKGKCSTTGEGKNCFTFWFSDGNRTHNVGEAVLEDNKDVVSSSIIYANDKLFFLHQHLDSSNKKFTLTRLEEQLQKINTTLEKWKSADGIVSELCKAERSHSETTCVGSLPPEGLVGFLSDKKENDKWEDKYLNVDAEVIGGAEINNGLICDSAGKGAKWPVSEGNENQAYNLKGSGFTLVAPVKISGNANQTNSILGVGLKGTASGSGQKSIGLWCSETGKWAVGKGEEQPTKLVQTSENCEQDETYSVVLVFNKGGSKLEVHIDGKQLEITLTDTMKIGSEESISYFYFGAGSNQNSVKTHVTIKYVLLYNRPLDGDIIENLKAKKREKPKIPTPPINGTINTQEDGKGTGETEKPSSTSATPTTTEKDGAEIKLCLFSMNSVTLLSLLMLYVFTLLGCYV